MKQLITIILAMGLISTSCISHEQENLSTKGPVVNKVQLSGYTKTDYMAKDLGVLACCTSKPSGVINDGGFVASMTCTNRCEEKKILVTIDSTSNIRRLDTEGIFGEFLYSTYDNLQPNPTLVLFGNNVIKYNFLGSTVDGIKLKHLDINDPRFAISSDGKSAVSFISHYDQSSRQTYLDLYPFNPNYLKNTGELVKNYCMCNGSTDDCGIIEKIVSNKVIVNTGLIQDSYRSSNPKSVVYDLILNKFSVINIISHDFNEKLYLTVVYKDNILIGISKLVGGVPKFVFVDFFDTSSRFYLNIPNVRETSVVKIVDYSSKVMYYTVTDNGVTNGYFYNMQNQRFYEDNDVIQILTNYTMDDSKLSTVSLSQNDKYLLLDFKYDSVNPTTKPYITKIVFDDSFANFLNDKIIPIKI